jgi:hypothetical protein
VLNSKIIALFQVTSHINNRYSPLKKSKNETTIFNNYILDIFKLDNGIWTI